MRFSRLGILILSFLAMAAVKPASGASEQGWVLEQFSESVPTHTNYITPNAFKSVPSVGGFAIVSKAPDWKVYVYNNKSKVIWSVPFQNFKGEMAARIYGTERQDLMKCVWTKKAVGNFLGQTCVEYATRGTRKENDPNVDPRGHVFDGYFMTLPVPVPKQAYTLLAKIYQLPVVPGLPMKLMFKFSMIGQLDHIKGLDTRRIQKTIIADKEFALPVGYRTVKTEDEVFLDPASKAAMQEFTQWTDPNIEKRKTK